MAIPFNYLPKDSVETFVDISVEHWEAIFGKKKQAWEKTEEELDENRGVKIVIETPKQNEK